MILLLSDETWQRLTDVLSDADDELLAQLTRAPERPSDRELVRMARADEMPEVFVQARALREAGIEASAHTRRALAELVRDVHGAGVGAAVLSRWSGLKASRVYEILNGGE